MTPAAVSTDALDSALLVALARIHATGWRVVSMTHLVRDAAILAMLPDALEQWELLADRLMALVEAKKVMQPAGSGGFVLVEDDVHDQ